MFYTEVIAFHICKDLIGILNYFGRWSQIMTSIFTSGQDMNLKFGIPM